MQSSYLHHGPITTDVVSQIIAECQPTVGTGAMATFLGQVRADKIERNRVDAIDYSAYNLMAEQRFHEIVIEAKNRFELTGIRIYHSIGTVNAGEFSLFVLVSSKHRKTAFDALETVVNQTKYHVPIWKKERFTSGEYRWVDESQNIHHTHNTKKAEI